MQPIQLGIGFSRPNGWPATRAKNWNALTIHIAVYTATLAVVGMFLFGPLTGLAWAVLNGLAHMAVDAVTSRITSWAYRNERTGLFWKTIGVDQFLHYLCLITSTVMVLQ